MKIPIPFLNDKTPRLEWERLKSNNKKCVPDFYRTPIEGGWLVGNGMSLTFVPDPNHQWDGSNSVVY